MMPILMLMERFFLVDGALQIAPVRRFLVGFGVWVRVGRGPVLGGLQRGDPFSQRTLVKMHLSFLQTTAGGRLEGISEKKYHQPLIPATGVLRYFYISLTVVFSGCSNL